MSSTFTSPFVDPAALDEWEAFVAQVLYRPRAERLDPPPPPRPRPIAAPVTGRVWPSYLLYLACGALVLLSSGLLVDANGVHGIGGDPLGALRSIGDFFSLFLRGTTGAF